MVCARRSTSDSFRFTSGSRKHLQGIPETARIVPGTPGKKRRRARVIPDPLSVMGYLVMDDAWATRNAARSHFETNDRQVFHYWKNSQNSWNSHKQCLELFQERATILKSEAKIYEMVKDCTLMYVRALTERCAWKVSRNGSQNLYLN